MNSLCEICDLNPCKYKCPSCDIKTCSLICCKTHKSCGVCDGNTKINKRTNSFISSNTYDSEQFFEDVSFLENIRENLDKSKYCLQKLKKKRKIVTKSDICSKIKNICKNRYQSIYIFNIKYLTHNNNTLTNDNILPDSNNTITNSNINNTNNNNNCKNLKNIKHHCLLRNHDDDLYWKIEYNIISNNINNENTYPVEKIIFENNFILSSTKLLDLPVLKDYLNKTQPYSVEGFYSIYIRNYFNYNTNNSLDDYIYETVHCSSSIEDTFRDRIIVNHPLFFIVEANSRADESLKNYLTNKSLHK